LRGTGLNVNIKMHMQSKQGNGEEPILKPVHPVSDTAVIADQRSGSKKKLFDAKVESISIPLQLSLVLRLLQNGFQFESLSKFSSGIVAPYTVLLPS
jgi:hypothetical protein